MNAFAPMVSHMTMVLGKFCRFPIGSVIETSSDWFILAVEILMNALRQIIVAFMAVPIFRVDTFVNARSTHYGILLG